MSEEEDQMITIEGEERQGMSCCANFVGELIEKGLH